MADYFDAAHAREIASLRTSFMARTEWPTWLLIALIYGGWCAVVLCVHAGVLSLWMATPLLIVLCTWHMSLQHELLHGHPTRSAFINRLLGSVPLAIWYPYTIYRDSHIAHHHDETLTVPGIDPESNYVTPEQWINATRVQRAVWHMRKDFIGRLLIGPPLSVATMLAGAFGEWRRGDRRYVSTWIIHALLVALLLAALDCFAGIPWWYYLLAVTWPALSLAMIRSLYEHRVAREPKHRTVINEAGLLMRLLYLNNNYHLVHHDLPHLPWYQLPRAYRMRREAYAAKNGGFVIHGGYWELLTRYALHETDFPVFPRLVEQPVNRRMPRRAHKRAQREDLTA
ncbi:fatty acid desaturase [Paraburkholderia sp. C35]|uniref:fatty acid desaturase n=1 Tax=Paraburkholderia sp. C35 TaxID=2126993 RepID=UPI000D691199